MRVAFFTYPSAFQNIGGGEILMLQLKKALSEKGIDARLFDPWNDRLKTFDLLHVFSCQSECLGLVRMASSSGVPVVVHPIAFETWDSVWHGVDPKIRFGSLMRFIVKKLYPNFPSDRRSILKLADQLFPNSIAEAEYLTRHFGVPRDKMFMVPNGVDAAVESASPEPFLRETGIREEFILCSGRIEPRKNQKNFIQAANRLNIRAVVLGDAVKGYEGYYEECRRLAGENIKFIPALSHESGVLYSAYAASRAVVLPAFVETPGLVGLEAGILGRPLSVTTGGPTKEYYAENACYLNPSSVDSIRRSVESALKQSSNPGLKDRIKQHYTWDKVAARLIEGYERVLK